jgi:hypothetical protein
MPRPGPEAPARPKCPRCGYEMMARYARTAAHGGKNLSRAFLFFRFFVLDVYEGTGERIHIDLGDVF